MLDTITTGQVLRRSRELSGLSERAAARALGVRRTTLRGWETDRVVPGPEQVELAAVVYGHGTEDIWADRAPLIDPEQPGLLVVGTERISVRSGDSDEVDNRDVIERYLAAVRRQRGVDEHDDIPLRANDLGALSLVLDLDDEELQAILMDLLDLTAAGAQWAIRSMLVGGLVAMVATGALGGSWFAPSASADTAPDMGPSASVAEVVIDDPVDTSGLDLEVPATTDASDTDASTATDTSVPGIAVERDAVTADDPGTEAPGFEDPGAEAPAVDQPAAEDVIIEGDAVPVEISEEPLTIERDQWDREQQELGELPGTDTEAPPAPSASLGSEVEAVSTFDTGVVPHDRAPDRRSLGLPLFAVEHGNHEVVVDPPVFSVHAPGAQQPLGTPLFAPDRPTGPTTPDALGPGPSALPPSTLPPSGNF